MPWLTRRLFSLKHIWVIISHSLCSAKLFTSLFLAFFLSLFLIRPHFLLSRQRGWVHCAWDKEYHHHHLLLAIIIVNSYWKFCVYDCCVSNMCQLILSAMQSFEFNADADSKTKHCPQQKNHYFWMYIHLWIVYFYPTQMTHLQFQLAVLSV